MRDDGGLGPGVGANGNSHRHEKDTKDDA